MTQSRRLTLLSLLTLVPVAVMWVIMFGPQPFNFWIMMTLSQCAMITAAWILSPGLKNHFGVSIKEGGIGLAAAVLLYGVFLLGNALSGMLFDFAGTEIQDIYSVRSQGQAVVIGMALLIIGPGEEIYWRGLIQRTLSDRLGARTGLIIATILYSVVHIAALNFMLVGAAAVCGLFWGLLYLWRKSLFAAVVSHTVWDIMVMVLFPIGQG